MASKKELEQRIAILEAQVAGLLAQRTTMRTLPIEYPKQYPHIPGYPTVTC
jgi:hypothetical protein